MKIWKAELILCCKENNGYEVNFYFELQKKEYRVNEKFNEWIHSEDWTCDRIPMEMMVEYVYNTRVIQGFDHKLNEEELKNLEKEMRVFMQEQLDYEKEIFLKRYDNKLKAILLIEED